MQLGFFAVDEESDGTPSFQADNFECFFNAGPRFERYLDTDFRVIVIISGQTVQPAVEFYKYRDIFLTINHINSSALILPDQVLLEFEVVDV